MCAITEHKNTKARFTTSKNVIMKFIHKQPENPFIKKEGDIHFYGFTNRTAKYSNHLLLYIQILDHFNIINHKRATETGGLLLARHAFYVYNPTNIEHLSDKEGDYKPEEFNALTNHKKVRDVYIITMNRK